MLCKKLFLASVLFFVLVTLPLIGSVGASLELWSQTYGGASYETAQSVVETSDGGLAIAGGTTSFGAGEYDFWLVKTDNFGNMEWNKTFGEKDDDYAYSLIETSDKGFALIGRTGGTGSFLGEEYDVLLIKTDEHGNMEWNRTYGGKSGDNAASLIQTSDGGYAFAGYTGFSTGGCDYWLVKTDSNGNMEWDMAYAIIDEEMAQKGVGTYNRATSLVETSDGGFALIGDTGLGIAGSPRDVWLVKTDEYGNMEWNRTFGGTSYEYACSLAVTSDGGYAFAGLTRSFGAGLDDFWLVKTDAYGNMEWNQTFGGTDYDDASAMVVTSDGGFALAGHTVSFGAGKYDFWLVKTDAYGNVQWNQTYGGEGYEDANSLVQTSDRGYLLAGAINSVYASSDWWVIKTDAQGIPEFPSWAPLIVTLTVVLVLAVIYRHYLNKYTQGRRKSEKVCISACSVDINTFA
jgi:hypothetical protein